MTTQRPKAIPTVQVDDDTFRVTEWHFPPGSETGDHVHGMDYVVVPMTTGTLTIVNDDGTTFPSEMKAGQSYSRKTGVAHNVINENDFPITFVEIEAK
ncbi:cupin domain-containing protein [Thalassospira sp.]|uniref:cupin domain-containing protein n=1 Tax=Thalassospira sp. TaxID=1912094 RepID=UPI000C58036B|nr:cupin domain-containing protein [Thalassospira sp.]MBC04871.1 cupin [Thalassospira sp.]